MENKVESFINKCKEMGNAEHLIERVEHAFKSINTDNLERANIDLKQMANTLNQAEREARQLSSTKTDFLFDEVIAPAIDKALTKPIKIGYFDLRDSLKANSNEFKKAISSITFACSDEERKPILTGANFNLKNNELNIIATDSFKLAKVKVENVDSGEFNFTIAKTDLNNLIKLIPE